MWKIVLFLLKVWFTMALLAFIFVACASAETISGPVTRVSDGDTLTISGVRVRLNGVDAPELDEKYGPQARLAMYEITDGQVVTCALGGKSYDRRVGVCLLPDGTDIGATLISQGLALDCPRYSGGRYRHLETNPNLSQKGYCK